jgi:hypothetical protein
MSKRSQVKIHIGKKILNISDEEKTIIHIPRMFTVNELEEIIEEIPEDFSKTIKEFWDYINERLRNIPIKISWVYTDISLQNRNNLSAIVDFLVKKGAILKSVEDNFLNAEVKAWFEMIKNSKSSIAFEMYKESREELNKHIVTIIKNTLKEGEIGVLFINSDSKISFPKKIRIIRMFPFHPQDYLNRQKAKERKS